MNAGKKYLFILPDLCGGGAERVTLFLIERLQNMGYQVDILLFKDYRAYDTSMLSQVRFLSLLQTSEKISRHLPKFIVRYFRLVREYDVLIAGLEFWPSYMVSIASLLQRKKTLWVNHTCLSRYVQERGFSHGHLTLTRILSRLAGRIISVSEGAKTDLIENVGVDKRKIQVIQNPHDLERIQKLSREPLSDEEERFLEKPVILFAGRLAKHKGCDLLISAFGKLVDRGYDINLLMIGDTSEAAEFEEQIRVLGLQNRVLMPGFKENPYKYMSRSAVFVLPSRIEGFPMVLVEAMTCGCPVIAADCPTGPAEILEMGKYGSLVKMEDADGIVSAAEELLTDGHKRDELVRMGLQRASEFEGSKVAKLYAEVLNSL